MRSMSAAGSDELPTSISRTFLVRGHVQGVGFRWWARGQAERLGISGDVRNLSDGSVQVRARGSNQALAAFASVLSEGPPGARVTGIDERPGGAVPEDGFEIER